MSDFLFAAFLGAFCGSLLTYWSLHAKLHSLNQSNKRLRIAGQDAAGEMWALQQKLRAAEAKIPKHGADGRWVKQ